MPVGRHRHAINVRADGLASVLGTLLQDPAVQAALLVDVDSGMVLDACGPRFRRRTSTRSSWARRTGADAAGPRPGVRDRLRHDAARRSATARSWSQLDGGRHLVLGRVPDPYGDRLALSVLVCRATAGGSPGPAAVARGVGRGAHRRPDGEPAAGRRHLGARGDRGTCGAAGPPASAAGRSRHDSLASRRSPDGLPSRWADRRWPRWTRPGHAGGRALSAAPDPVAPGIGARRRRSGARRLVAVTPVGPGPRRRRRCRPPAQRNPGLSRTDRRCGVLGTCPVAGLLRGSPG